MFPVASPPERSIIHLNLAVNPDHPAFLEGLENWLQLGLISHEAIQQLCQLKLTCPLPDPTVQQVAPPVSAPAPPRPPASSRPTPPLPHSLTPPAPPRPPSIADRLVAEISVLWLLFLGVFLVVVSSGVLAATQWRNFSAIGQYGILFSYTLAFWVASLWTSRQDSLRLTTRMLRGATLLIIPLNFWMMDGFHLWQSGIGWMMAAIAAIVLTFVTVRTLVLAPDTSKLLIGTAIGLNFLNWGWGWAGFPLVATYLGTIGTSAAILAFDRPAQSRDSEGAGRNRPLGLGTITLAFGALLLVFRAAFVAHVPPEQLALAIGISGWLLVWQSRLDATRKLWLQFGVGLLLLGWLLAVQATLPGQAIVITGLVLWLLVDALRRSPQRDYVTLIFLVGLQLCWLLWRMIPAVSQQWLIDRSIQLAGTEGMPIALIGLGLFPYLALTLGFSDRLRRQQQPALAKQTEFLALGLGSALTLVSLGNPLARSVNLLLSAIVLLITTRKRPQAEPALINLTHAVTVAAIGAGINVAFPKLSETNWAIVLLVGMAVEWGLAAFLRPTPTNLPPTNLPSTDPPNPWQQSTWRFGLLLAGGSYWLFLQNFFQDSYSTQRLSPACLWLIAPAILTALSYRSGFPQRRVASRLSLLALLAVQLLTFFSMPDRTIGLGVATGLMLLNTRQIAQVFPAVLTIGFGLCFGLNSLWELGGKNFQTDGWFSVLAIVALLLWGLRHWLSRRESALANSYQRASDGWAIGLVVLMLPLFSFGICVLYGDQDPTIRQYLPATALLLTAVTYRTWQRSSNWGFYAIAWSLEILVVNLLGHFTYTLESVVIANLAIAFLAQLLGDWQQSRTHSPTLSSWHTIPLLYAAGGLFLAHQSFTATTGLFTIAAALVGIGIGRRRSGFKPVTFLCLLGVSFGAYELLIYQLSRASGGQTGDGVILLAVLAAAIAIVLRLLQRWIGAYTRLNEVELQTIAHLHWGFGSVLLLLTRAGGLSFSSEWPWLGVAAVLSAYALATGNSRWTPGTVAAWTHLGIAEFLLTLAYLLHLLLPDAVLLDWGGAIATIVAVILYWLPWQKWGWSRDPGCNWAIALPGLVTALTAESISVQSLLIVAAFYAWLAKAENQVRLSYLSVLLADWAILRSLDRLNVTEPLWYAAVLSGSLLYVAQVDPGLSGRDDRQKRHWLRSLATGLICFTGFYQAEVGISGVCPLLLSGLVLLLHLGFVGAGLVLRIRAFLYIGTIAFLLQVLRQLWVYVAEYSILLWSIGIVLGLLLIWIAATFEARRTQVSALLQYWVTELESWD